MILGLLLWLMGMLGAMAQIPEPRVNSVFPPGAKAGVSGLEVSVNGENLDDPVGLVFSHPGISGVSAQSDPTPLSGKTWALGDRYGIAVGADVPPGSYELRFKGRFGLSNAVAFEIGNREEVVETNDNHAAENAMPLADDVVINGRADAGRADFFRVSVKAGETLRIRCRAGQLDSPLQPDVIVLDATGARERARASVSALRDARLDWIAPGDGDFLIRIADFLGKGGGDYVYRLSLDGDSEMGKTVAKQWEFAGIPRVPKTGDGTEPMPLMPPCVVEGTWNAKNGDEHFHFAGVKGQSYVVEVISERLGHATDPMLRIERHEPDAEGKVGIVNVGTFDDIEQGGGRMRLPLGSRDAVGRFVAETDGDYHLILRDQFGSAADAGAYWLRVSEPRPDFSLVAVAVNPVAEGKGIAPGPVVLRSGGTLAFEVHALRRDGFEGGITLRCEGLPEGIGVENAVIPGHLSETLLLLRAGEISERWDGVFRIIGNGGAEGRGAQAMRLRGQVGDYDREEVRYAEGADLALTLFPEESPLRLVFTPETALAFESSLGGVIELPVQLVRTGTFKGNVRIRPAGIAGVNQPPELNLDEKTGEGVLSIPLANRDNNLYAPGEIAFHVLAEGTINYEPNIEAKTAAEMEKVEAEMRAVEVAEKAKAAPEDKELAEEAQKADAEKNLFGERARVAAERSKARDVKVFAQSVPVTLRLAASPVRFAEVTVAEGIEAGGEGTVKVVIERAYGFAGEVLIEAVLPEASAKALRIEAATVPNDQTEVEVKVAVPAEAVAASYPIQLKAKLNFNGMDLETTQDVVVPVRATVTE